MEASERPADPELKFRLDCFHCRVHLFMALFGVPFGAACLMADERYGFPHTHAADWLQTRFERAYVH